MPVNTVNATHIQPAPRRRVAILSDRPDIEIETDLHALAIEAEILTELLEGLHEDIEAAAQIGRPALVDVRQVEHIAYLIREKTARLWDPYR